mmetsp:Transcript_13540/g.25391  ORF Transcript_13540/g.25391 Transcript_13540/m.25391 type:complete len:620 (-) Transcript_13540:78-1937(-)
MPMELLVRTWSAPEDFRRHERTGPAADGPNHAARSAGMSTTSRRRPVTSSSSTSLPTSSQVAVRQLHTSGGERSRATSWTNEKGNWIHRSSSAPYQDDVNYKQHRLPKVLLARLGSWRPSTAAGKGAPPATMPELFPLKPHFRPGRGAEEELDQRIDALKEIFAEATPRSTREWTMPPRLEELSKPRVVTVPPALAFRESTPPQALIKKKKRRPIHIPMSFKEKMDAKRDGASFEHELHKKLNRMADKYDSSVDFGGSSPVRSEQSRRRQNATATEKTSTQPKGAEVSKTGKSAKSAAKPKPKPKVKRAPVEQKRSISMEELTQSDVEPAADDEDAESRAKSPAASAEGDSESGEPDTAADEEYAESEAAAESEDLAESEQPPSADSEAADALALDKEALEDDDDPSERAPSKRTEPAELEPDGIGEDAAEKKRSFKEPVSPAFKESEAAPPTPGAVSSPAVQALVEATRDGSLGKKVSDVQKAPVGIGIGSSQPGGTTGGETNSIAVNEGPDESYSGFENSGTASPGKLSSAALTGHEETLPGQVAEVPRKIPRNLKLPELPRAQQEQIAALRIQSQYRGRLGRRKFAARKAASEPPKKASKEHESEESYSDEDFDED